MSSCISVNNLHNQHYCHYFNLRNLQQMLFDRGCTLFRTSSTAIGVAVPIACMIWLQASPSDANPTPQDLDLTPEIIQTSPVLKKWLKGIPDVMADIEQEPSFRTRVKVGYSTYPAAGQTGGYHLSVDDVFLGKGGLSASANYNGAFDGNRRAYGVDVQYYLLPLGRYLNISPIVGYRRLETDLYRRDGLNLGVKLMVVGSRGGGADISLSQSWVGLGGSTETGLTTLSVGYAVTNNLRISTDIQQQNARERYDSRVGIGVEFMP